jgi:single-stranded-DNA-specific exonuclease
LGNLILAARAHGLLVAGGGHGMAAGFTVEQAKLAAFQEFLEEQARRIITAEKIVPTLVLDAAPPLSALTADLATTLEKLAPFGAGNPQPRLLLENVLLLKVDMLGTSGQHLRLLLGDGTRQTAPVKAMAFRCGDGELGQFLLEHRGRRVDIAGTLQRDTWGGADKAQIFVEDARGARGEKMADASAVSFNIFKKETMRT